jgi:Tol biopolymer transport system component
MNRFERVRRIYWVVAVLIGCLTFSAAPALAAPPEAPKTEAVTVITATTATLHGVLNPNATAPGEAGHYEFLYKASPSECAGASKAPEPPGVALGFEHEEVPAQEVTGLTPHTEYTVCLLARNLTGEETVGPPVTFTTSGAVPIVTGELVSSVGSSEATVSAQVNPGGLPTTYTVQYGTSTEYGSSTTEASAGAGTTAAGVQIHLTGLQQATTYHARVVAHNELGTQPGGDLAFTTASATPPTGLSLPDGRAYELVSPVNIGDGEVYPPITGHELEEGISREPIPQQTVSGAPVRAAADGSRVAYTGEPPVEGGNGSTGNGQGNTYLAARTPGGWGSQSVSPPGGKLGGETYQGFSADVSLGFFTGGLNEGEQPPFTPDAPPNCDVLYSASSDRAYHAVFTETQTPGECGGPTFAGISADDSHVIFESGAALTPGSTAGSHNGFGTLNLYESAAGHTYQVNVLPNGHPDVNATFGGGSFGQVISRDGSRIVWTDLNTEVTPEDPTGETRLFVRENADAASAKTVQADASVGGGGEYLGASADGSLVLFAKAGDLYVYDVDTAATTDLAHEAQFMGVVGFSDDGSRVYFVAGGVLASNQNANHEGAIEGEPNLYVASGGLTTFIARLPGEDGDWRTSFKERTAEVTPDGSHVVFMSRRSLTGYDNRGGCAAESGRCAEVFVYDAGTQQLSCASCNPDGQPPVAVANNINDNHVAERVGGAFLPVPEPSATGTYQPRWISDDGSRVFVDTAEPLVPQDTNRVQDVYEWERNGAGSCSQSAGCIYLISGNLSHGEAFFIDASASGNDVFFTSRAELVPQDRGEAEAVYDARVGGGFPEVSQACTGAGCQGVPPAPPAFATPSSATFNGTGNFPAPPPAPPAKGKTAQQLAHERLARALKACRKKHNTRKRRACEKQAHRKYAGKASAKHAKRAKRAANDRRTGR